jgi:hypothetical protein
MSNYIGIDIGNEGAIAILMGGFVDDILPMPVTTLAKRRTTDRASLLASLSDHPDSTVIVEEASQHLQSQKVAASMWFSYRGVLDALEDSKMRFVLVPARTWQKEFSFRPGNTKEQSIATCKSLFPTLSLKRTPKRKNDDDNFADAVLLAEYGRRKAL